MEKYKSHFTGNEYDNYTQFGTIHLNNYYDQYHHEWLAPWDYRTEYVVKLTEYKGVPISGKLDRDNIFPDRITVTDYKTGSFDSQKLQPPSDKNPDGGDYWRQIMFYKLVMDGDKKQIGC